MDRQAGDIDVQVCRMRVKARRMAVQASRMALKAHGMVVRVVRISAQVLRMTVEALRFAVEARRTGVRVRKLFVEACVWAWTLGRSGLCVGRGVGLCGEFRGGAWGRPRVLGACRGARGGLKKFVYRAWSRAHECAPVGVWGARALHSFNSRRGILASFLP